jgi:hypothetical protein
MKQLLFAAVFSIAFTSALPQLVAQTSAVKFKESSYYYATVLVDKVYSTPQGYVLTYRPGLSRSDLANIYLPIEWFNFGEPHEIVWIDNGAVYPHMDIFYNSGKFAFVRLFIRKDKRHPTWGYIPSNVDLTSRFAEVTEVTLEYDK